MAMNYKACLLAFVMSASASAFAQGQINFANRITTTPTVDAPILAPGGAKASGANGYFAQLYVGLTADSLQPLGVAKAVRSDGGIGYVVASAVTTAFAGGTKVFVQMWAWSGAADYATASSTIGATIGKSNTIEVTVGDPGATPPGVPANLTGLTAIQTVAVVPEPATLALAAIGGIGLLTLRRKNA